jgi:outer membrane lipoprotein
MTPKGLYRFLLIGFCSLIFSGCAHVMSPELREQADPSLTFPLVHGNVTAHVGSTVIWGGEIISTVNKETGTDITVLETPLLGDGRPEAPIYSQGRFIARSSRFLDPAVYKSGRIITIGGKLVGAETEALGKTEYTYPVVQIEEIHLWHRELVAYPPPYHWGWGWGWSWSSPYYRPYGRDYDWEWR